MLKKSIPLCAGLFLLAASLQAQTIEQCYEWAEQNSPLVAKYDLLEKSKDYTISSAKQAWIPQIVLSGQATYQSDVTNWPESLESLFASTGLEFEGLHKDQYKVALDINQTIWDGGASKYTKQIAETEAKINLKNVESQIYSLKERVNSLFFGILMLDENLKLNKEMEIVLQSNIKTVTALVENGAEAESSLDALRVEEVQCRQNRRSMEASREAYVNMLSLITGHEITELVEPEEPQISLGWENRPDVQILDLQKENIEARRKSLTSAKMPKFSAFAQGYYGYPGLNMFEDMVSYGFSWNYMVGVRMQWNISSFFTGKNDQRKLDNSLLQIDTDRQVLDFNYSLKTAEQNNLIRQMKAVLEEDEEIIRLRESLRETREAEVENGVASVPDLIREISNENSAKLNATSHKLELLKNLYDLKITNN